MAFQFPPNNAVPDSMCEGPGVPTGWHSMSFEIPGSGFWVLAFNFVECKAAYSVSDKYELAGDRLRYKIANGLTQ